MSDIYEMVEEVNEGALMFARYQQLGSVHRVGAEFGVHGNTIHRKLKAAGYDISRPAEFTDAQRAAIVEYYTSTPAEAFDLSGFAASLGKDKANVSRAARRLGLSDITRPRSEATVQQLKESRQGQWQRFQHPRGMAGKSHTAEVKALVARASKKYWATCKAFGTGLMSPQSRSERSERMAVIAASKPASNNYSRTKAGVRSDIGPMYFRSSWEANYARYLNMLMKLKVVESWEFEPETFWFLNIKRGVRSYRVDFRIKYRGEEKPTYVEVKGWMDPKSRTKIARFKKYYPQHRLEVVDQKAYRALKEKWSSSIAGWE